MSNRGKRTILIVDDQKGDRESLSRLLEQHGYTVLQASDHRVALEVYEQHKDEVNMLLTAIALPGTNGYELAKSLFQFAPRLKVLFMSGPTGAEVSRFYNMPISGPHLLAKPVQPEELLIRVRQVFRTRIARPYAKGAY